MHLLLGMVGICYVVAFTGFWSIGRMAASSDKMVKARAKVIPIRRD